MNIKQIIAKLKDKDFRNKVIMIAVITILCLAMQCFTIIFLKHLPLWLRIAAILLITFINVCSVLFCYIKKQELFRLSITVIVFTFIILSGFIVLDAVGFFETFSSFDALKNFVLSTGKWGKVIYVLITILQVVLIPIPSVLTEVVAANLFGPTTAFLLSACGIIIGSAIAYFIGRTFGIKVVSWIVGKKTADEYISKLRERGKLLFVIMITFPFFPDDIICMAAGVIKMPYWFFMLIVVFARPIGSAMNCYLGSGNLIPFEGWGIPVWILIFIGMAGLFYLSTKITKSKKPLIDFNNKYAVGRKLFETDKEHEEEPKIITNPAIINDRELFEKLKNNSQILNQNNKKK